MIGLLCFVLAVLALPFKSKIRLGCRRPVAALECLDDDHAAAAARTRMRERLGLVGLVAVGIPGLGLCRRHVEQAARSGDVVGARATGEQAVVADAVEAVRQDVNQESADKRRDAERIKPRFEMLISFLQHDDVERVTKHDIVRWRDHRLANKITVKTINDSDIASFKNVFNWGVDRKRLAYNPAEGGTIKRKKRRAKLRDEYYAPAEASAVLLCAASVSATRREDPKTTAAKRWVPWLCAYSGARVSEMIQLRKKDLRKDAAQGWVLRLTPEAGSIKTNQFCDVPVHEHLIATGFVEFVNKARDGHLFCNLGKDGTITGPAEGVYKRIYEMVRDVIKGAEVQPNHAWRYTFKTYGLEAGIEEAVLDAISNHGPKHQGGRYTKVTLKARADAMARFPRYSTTSKPPEERLASAGLS